ncbi:hypothetical protein GF407_18270 [candidate division KSB1 bacterium]|nr:hypothetical protein [candidate division KSB1 bacterium]
MNMTSSWRDSLISDHHFISHVLDIIAKTPSQQSSINRLKEILSLLLEFTDKYHNIKEENYLFPLLVERGIPQSGAIHNMIMEHEAERELLIKMIASLESPTPGSSQVIFKKIDEYIASRKSHMLQEEKQLFSRKTFTAKDDEKLQHAFEQFVTKLYNKNVNAHFHNKLAEIERNVTQAVLYGKISGETLEKIIKQFPYIIFYFDRNYQLSYTNTTDEKFQLGKSIQECFPKDLSQRITTSGETQNSEIIQHVKQTYFIRSVLNDFNEPMGYLVIRQNSF